MSKESFYNTYMTIGMGDNSVWKIPVIVIALDRANAKKDQYDGDINKSLTKDTIPLFMADESRIFEWVENEMDFVHAKRYITRLHEPNNEDMLHNGWKWGNKSIISA